VLFHGGITASGRTRTGDKKDLDDLFRARLDSRSLEAYEASEEREAYS